MAFVGFAITYWIFDASRETSMAIGTGFFGGGVAEILLELWKNRYGGRNKRRHPKLDEE